MKQVLFPTAELSLQLPLPTPFLVFESESPYLDQPDLEATENTKSVLDLIFLFKILRYDQIMHAVNI